MNYLRALGFVVLMFAVGVPCVLAVVWLPIFFLGTTVGPAIPLGVMIALLVYVVAEGL